MSGYAFYGSYRDNTSSSEACPVAYLKSRFEFIEGGTFWLSATPSVVGSKAWGNGIENSGYPRICTWALLRDKANGGVFCFAGTHLDLNAGPRLAGMRLILSSLVEKYGALRATTIPLSPTCGSLTRTTSPAARCASRSTRAWNASVEGDMS